MCQKHMKKKSQPVEAAEKRRLFLNLYMYLCKLAELKSQSILRGVHIPDKL